VFLLCQNLIIVILTIGQNYQIIIEHYRCQPSIIQYCNTISNYGLEVKTEPVNSLLESHLIAYHVEGNIHNNINEEEITAVCEIVQHLLTQGYSIEDIDLRTNYAKTKFLFVSTSIKNTVKYRN
jgi:hypothetical protein